MAGSYPDSPSRRMAWDDDGTIMLRHLDNSGTITELNQTIKTEANDEDDNVVAISNGFGDGQRYYWIHLFPELREVDGIYVSANSPTFGICPLTASTDSTNGFDGTFTSVLADLNIEAAQTLTGWRDNITSTAKSNVRALKLETIENSGGGGRSWYSTHIYGEITPGQTPDRLLFVEAGSGLEFNLPIDYGDIPRGSAADLDFKLRNNSAGLTANTVQVTAEDNYKGSGSWYTFSEGGAFQSTLALASSIGNGADSPTITIRRIVPDTEALLLHTARIQVNAASWT